ncbi:hypothetical protein N5J43_16815 [Pseudomonas nicosulfuronedens]|uniref:hypothetical protein n=1 Tax=Pseudomonas TaxID=286 RepID=UPI001F24EADD|nr:MULTISPECIES: hypothetical protein [Pseudomonas]MDH1012018.1 hypothetical protein [Pseudomonas nicosulfuronedens]MDH1980614.1 hypothetical protein [Pseudomonas nicosulfuronedens]MDH2027564.1 hypothetical protein [Pseudomonas nicosulfuronedens]
MQQLNIRPQLAELLPLTAAARAAFEERRTIVVEKPAYQLKPVGKGFWHIVDTATEKAAGFRRSYGEAKAYAERLTIRKRDDIGAEG